MVDYITQKAKNVQYEQNMHMHLLKSTVRARNDNVMKALKEFIFSRNYFAKCSHSLLLLIRIIMTLVE